MYMSVGSSCLHIAGAGGEAQGEEADQTREVGPMVCLGPPPQSWALWFHSPLHLTGDLLPSLGYLPYMTRSGGSAEEHRPPGASR